MELNNLFSEYKIKKPTKQLSERAEIIKKFVDRLNADRVSSGRKPLSAGFYAMKMYQYGLKTNSQFHRFYGNCADANNFSSFWWWKITKEKNEKNNTNS